MSSECAISGTHISQSTIKLPAPVSLVSRVPIRILLTFNPDQTGEICLDLLKDSWSPAYTLTSTLEAIHQLLAYPEVDSPLNIDIARLLKDGDRIGGESLVRFWCLEKRWSG